MNLILDFGNTYKKIAAVSQGKIVCLTAKTHIEVNDIVEIERNYDIKNAVLSSVVDDTETEIVERYLEEKYKFLKLSKETKLPIQNAYLSKSTLGSDRLACAVAAYELFPQENVLVLQLGTCLTSDFITKEGVYLGGSISPGMNMRFEALHHFSAKLPLVEYQNIHSLLGKSTEESILSGVIYGITAECDYIINSYKERYENIKIILTGGKAKKFEHTIKSELLALDNFVILGLDAILRYNVEN
jgi:type III pantothenate kinase